MRFLRSALVAVGLALVAGPGNAAGLAVRGWLIHTPDRAYIDRVLAAAPSYGINHLDISHSFVANIDEILERPGLADLVEQTARRAKRLGIESYVWSHELNTRNHDLVLDPSQPDGKAFWDSRKTEYRRALRRCPSVAGVVLMFGSCPTEVWDARITDPYWNSLTWGARIRFVTHVVQSVVSKEMGRGLWVRDFNHSPKQLHALVDGLRDFPGITVYSKSEPQDFQLFYPHSFSIGAYGRTPQVLELDLNGEYWGQSVVPVSLVRYLRYRVGYGVRKGVVGAVGRIDTSWNRALGTPSEINLYACSRLMADPSASEQSIYDGWLSRRYKLKPGSAAARQLQTILARSLEFAKSTYYTRGFWTPKDQSAMPESMREITGCIAGKSTCLWDPAARVTEDMLRNPDGNTVAAILAEKAAGIAAADRNCREFAPLRSSLRALDYDDLSRRLALAAQVARIYRSVANAYWGARLVQVGRAPDGAIGQVKAAADDLDGWAGLIEDGEIALPRPQTQARDLRTFAEEVRKATPQ
jgi:hypothetical protein